MLLLLGAGCNPSASEVIYPNAVVISVEGPSATQVTAVTIRTNSGQTVTLQVGTLELTNGGVPAPHLREHLVSGEPIDGYSRGGVLYRYTDAADAT